MGKTATLANIGSVADGSLGFRNRIINGAMAIDQRNAGASVTVGSGNPLYNTVDRWYCQTSQASKFTIQQNSGSVTPPAGFSNYLGITSSSAYTVGSSEYFNVGQWVEGYNITDLGWGTANAQSVTVSFWVRSSLTGTFGACLGTARFYPFNFTINQANTWEQKTITIAGPTSGSWNSTNGAGLLLLFSLGTGSTLQGTANVWSSTTYLAPTGSQSVVGTNGATFYITGVQLEKGSTATAFDYRPYGTELQLCQRYYETYTVPANYNAIPFQAFNSSSGQGSLSFKVTKRAAPSASLSQVGTFLATQPNGNAASGSVTLGYGALSVDAVSFTVGVTSGLTAGNISYMYSVAGATLAFSSEL